MDQGSPGTVVVKRQVRRGKEKDYEVWLERLIAGAASLPWYLGTNVLRPSTKAGEYTSVFGFDTVEHLLAFEESDLRRRALSEVEALVEADAVWQRLTGLELWFTAPPGTVMPQPSRFRMALVMIGGGLRPGPLDRHAGRKSCGGPADADPFAAHHHPRGVLHDLLVDAEAHPLAGPVHLPGALSCGLWLVAGGQCPVSHHNGFWMIFL
jgi:heme-degrading monooxygenase HmoA